jgi:two-component system, chemotaxis family, protein-glutamate methylesterase/glutaminase
MQHSFNKPIRVLVVEDSRVQRELLVGMLNTSGEFVVVGTASNGNEAITAAQQLRPNVIAMDIHLPILDGYEATRQIMQQCPTPIVLISSQDDAARRSIAALAVGALAVVAKPRGRVGAASAPELDDDRAAFLTTLRLMADVRVVTRHPIRSPTTDYQLPATGQSETLVVGRHAAFVVPQVLVIAASTGGPAALQLVLRGLGADFPLPVLVVQHIARGFVPALAEWLNTTVPLPVRVACQGERLLAGRVYLAPDDHHLTIRTPGFASLRPRVDNDRYCPSADHLFETAARAYGASVIGLVLTGMGDDGTRGLLALRTAGAPTLAQDAASCVVYGMPRAAVEAGAIMHSEPLATIAGTILGLVGTVARNVGVS